MDKNRKALGWLNKSSVLTLVQVVFGLCVVAFAGISLSGCTGLSRSRQSGYADRETPTQPNLGRDRRASERAQAAQDLGYKDVDDLNDRQVDAVANHVALERAEKALEGKREREQYFRNKPYMHSDHERMDFLNLSTFDARQKWLNAKGIQANSSQRAAPIQVMVDNNDIAVGMTKQDVRDSWGEPELVEVSGNPIYGHERWHYSEQTSSTEGYHSQQRLVFFESGRVAGWETH